MRRASAALMLFLLLVTAGCGSGNGMGHRTEIVGEVLTERMIDFEVALASKTDDRVACNVAERPTPQRQLLHVVVWKSWRDLNRMLTGEASSTIRHVDFCRRIGSVTLTRVCVVADRVTASGRPRCLTALVAMLRNGGVASS